MDLIASRKNASRARTHGNYNGPTEEDPYREVSFGDGITVQRVLVSPKLAEAWLDLLIERQRNLRPKHVAVLADDIVNDRWRLTHAAIAFNDMGQLIDGQHRLRAVLKTGRSIETFVFRGLPSESYDSIDSGAKRTGADTLRAGGYHNAASTASAALFYARYLAGNRRTLKTELNLSNAAIEELIADHPELATSVQKTHAMRGICGHHGATAVAHYVLSQIDHTKADYFFDRLMTGEDIGTSARQIYILRERFRRAQQSKVKITADEVFLFILKAWNLWRSGKKTMRFFKHGPTEQYPIPL